MNAFTLPWRGRFFAGGVLRGAFILSACVAYATPSLAIDPNRVLVVYNSRWSGDNDADGVQDSRQVADYYAVRRGIPRNHLLGLTCSSGTRTLVPSHSQFLQEMVVPIREKIDELGADKIDVILLCYGLPYSTVSAKGGGVCLDNALIGLGSIGSPNTIGPVSNPYSEATPSIDTDTPHFSHAKFKFNQAEMYLVSRIDGEAGQAPYSSTNLIDQALYAERYVHPESGHYHGTAYVDLRAGPYDDDALQTDPAILRGSFGTTQDADKNIANSKRFFRDAGFPVRVESTGYEIGEIGAKFSDGPSALTAPEAMFYAGWYNYMRYLDVWEWLPGSVACDLNSASCAGIRKPTMASFGPASLQRGATAVSGVVGEPYLTGHQRPNVLQYYLMKGFSFAEASILSTPTVGWMPINIGDPLYTPMKSKSPVIDTQNPKVADGFPRLSRNVDSATRTVFVAVDQQHEPEVVKIVLEYGFTKSYGQQVDSGQGYWASRAMSLRGLQGNSTYHYRLRMTDPAGNVTVTDDFSLTTRRVPNRPPEASKSVQIVQHDKPSTVQLDATDADGNHLGFTVVSGPSHGTVSEIKNRSCIYTPNPSYTGTDSFTFKANDGAADSNVATVKIGVMPTEEVELVLQQGLGGYSGAKDVLLYENRPNVNSGGSTFLETYANGQRRILLQFDLSQLPAGSVVASSKLELFCSKYGYPVASQPITLHRITRRWTEGTNSGSGKEAVNDGCTFIKSEFTDDDVSSEGNWDAPGGDYDLEVLASHWTDEVAPNRWIDWDIAELTQDWVSNTFENHGMLLRTQSPGILLSYFSKEYKVDPSKRPKLTIRYFPPAINKKRTNP